MKKYITKILGIALTATLLTGCSNVYTSGGTTLTSEQANKELESLITKVNVTQNDNPILDIYSEDTSEVDALADISTFPITVQGRGSINIEIAAPSELSGNAPDNWLNEVAEKFNASGATANGKSASVTIRKISSGEVVTYMAAGVYQPDVYIPSSEILGEMLKASGFNVSTLSHRIAGNTAGILMKKDVYDTYAEKYGDVTVKGVLDAANTGDLVFAYTNPYTSATGLNILSSMLYAFDSQNPLSDTATNALLEYQKTAPPVAYTTGVLRTSAAKGIINAMVMEKQAYINTSELKNYIYTPVGVRHDHPVYTFDYVSAEKQEVARQFVEFCLSSEMQKLATQKGFNQDEDYQSQDTNMNGNDYLAAQKVWKQNKNGGKPIVAVFITDVSGSMEGEALNSLKSSLINASSYISSDHYIGLVSYSEDVTINLPIAQFDATQRAYFSGEVKNLTANGATATYDAVLVGAKMLEEYAENLPEAKLMLFVLTDGAQNRGYSLDRITNVIGGLQIPVYTIAYNYDSVSDLEKLSNINEAAQIKANSDDVVNQLRNLFNVNL
ncbi:VWA domain-containing protein [Butyrivibrio sp.]|uniref:vWA domain-containing protein n=1 Tax=Butyrivibrio sp. TaxID=28121 RepID=UPI0025B871EB|nr:VWA domain-containing protein [Butyrivibrio sp.]MBQ9304126.1 VWA domain-containing protein [Butyrivibrio sp.]